MEFGGPGARREEPPPAAYKVRRGGGGPPRVRPCSSACLIVELGGAIGLESALLKDLNEAQREAVKHRDGPLLVIAGAGSGKTRVLTHRIAYLVEVHGASPSGILAVTFTNKAAREMKERLERLGGYWARQLWVGTFHSACVQILRRHADRLGRERSFVIYDRADQLTAVRAAISECDLDPKNFEPRSVLGAISAAKNALIDAEAYAQKAGDFWERSVARIYAAYEKQPGPA